MSPSSSSALTTLPEARIYNRTFWIAFAANIFLVTANTLTFRFAEFAKFLGGTEEITGKIVAAGLICSLFWRVFLGPALDRFGVRRVWLTSSLAYMAGGLLTLWATDIGWQLYLGRALFVTGLASMFASSLKHIQDLAPRERRTEIIASFGASGFLGMILGAQLGDVIFQEYPESRQLYHVLFGVTLLMGIFHTSLAAWMTTGDKHIRPVEMAPIHRLLVGYWPSSLLIVTLLMGIGFCVTTVFLTRYATELKLGGIRTFFTAYAVSACFFRVAARNWSRIHGRHQLIIWGMLAHAVGTWALTFVRHDWQFIPSALCGGFGHALLFPCVISLGAEAFPEQYRGTGTTITLGAIDLGTVLGAPALGWVIDEFGFQVMLYAVSIGFALATVLYAMLTRGATDLELAVAPVVKMPAPAPPELEIIAPAAPCGDLQPATLREDHPGCVQVS